MMQTGIEPVAVTVPQNFESAFKSGMEPAQPASCLRARLMHVIAEKIHD